MFGCDHGEAATRLASYKVPEALSIVDEFPRNALSKLDRSKLQAMAVAVQSAGQMESAAFAIKTMPRTAGLPRECESLTTDSSFVYRKLKHGRIGGEVRPRWRVN